MGRFKWLTFSEAEEGRRGIGRAGGGWVGNGRRREGKEGWEERWRGGGRKSGKGMIQPILIEIYIKVLGTGCIDVDG